MRVVWLGWEEIYTTRRVQEAALEQGLELVVCNIHDVSFDIEGQKANVSGMGENLLETCDGLVVRTFYPYISEALTVARLFHDAGKIVIDESLTDEGYAVSKMHDTLVMAEHGVPCPRTWQLFNPRQVETLAEQLTYPCLLKGVHGARGEHTYLIQNSEQLHRRLWHYPYGELMLQEYLPADEDYRVMVVGYRALPVMVRRKPPRDDFRTNYALGGHFIRHDLSEFPTFQTLAEQAARALRREFTAVDIRMKGDQPVILEVNRQPDFEGFERATHFDVASEVVRYIRERVGGK
ncbi:MAG: ATP-grasp domain-containing protein [Chloroflexi bacterium]|nr:MAG: ATP-grasp domain-containing protein [Chloroflexota bacterium]